MHRQLHRLLDKVSGACGGRPVASPANQAAAAYGQDVCGALGLVVEEQTYACTGWRCAGAWLSAGGDALPVEANAFSPACDVTATVVPAATLTELAAADLTDRIALLHGELVNEPLAPKSWFLAGERDHAIIGLLESKRPAPVLPPRARPLADALSVALWLKAWAGRPTPQFSCDLADMRLFAASAGGDAESRRPRPRRQSLKTSESRSALLHPCSCSCSLAPIRCDSDWKTMG